MVAGKNSIIISIESAFLLKKLIF